jgi:hypothetical protein
MNRYRKWVGGLHWGQLLLLVPALLFAGVASGVGALVFAENRDNSARSALYEAETALQADSTRILMVRKRPASMGGSNGNPFRRSLDEIFGNVKPLDTNLVRAVEKAQAERNRTKSSFEWTIRAGILGWTLAWLTAFLSLWWWFGARAKPRGTA